MYNQNFARGITPADYKFGAYNTQDPIHNKIINEAIVLDRLGGSKKALHEFYNHAGRFAYRDGILTEDASIVAGIESLDNKCTADTASILASAKEAGDADYDIYSKCVMLMERCLENMKTKYCDVASERVEQQAAIVNSNPRIEDAIEKVEAPIVDTNPFV